MYCAPPFAHRTLLQPEAHDVVGLSIRTVGFLGGSVVTNPPARQEVRVQSLGWEDALEKEMATHNKNIWTVKQG